jgi:leucyl-tRNA synthetase
MNAKRERTDDAATGSYAFREIEKRWRSYWLEAKTFKTSGPGDVGFDESSPKCYVLDMFPYTSGSGLHMGHPKGYIASDIYCRFKLMQGFNVLHPMGFDSFGLPAEQYAIEHNVHPAVATEENIDVIRGQLQYLGMAYDWDREIATSRSEYYKWTQWIFLQIYDSWFDADSARTDASGRAIQGRARPVSELVAAFESGARSLSADDLATLKGNVSVWRDLSEEERELVLSNYRLAYQKEVTVNWCPGLGTVLANEEVTNEGKSERGDFPVYKKPLKQWMMRITEYADRLLADLDSAALPAGNGETFELDWPEPIKMMQRNWIGRSEGAEVLFDVLDGEGSVLQQLSVFTTRPDTLFGATFMVLAPEHPLLASDAETFAVPKQWPAGTDGRWKGGDKALEIRDAIAAYVGAASSRTALDREDREKTGVFTGIMALNPVNDREIPVFVADYVSMEYGSGAIMAVPAHDDRDFEFARKYGLDIVQVVEDPKAGTEECFTGEGISINSPEPRGGPYAITGLATADAAQTITAALEASGRGRLAVNYKLRDWIFSRQRYWGEPFPLVQSQDGHALATDIPVLLPELDDFRPETSDDPDQPVTPPLSRAPEAWSIVEIDGLKYCRELNVMPQWAGSCWYFLRFIDPHNSETFCAKDKEALFMPVDLYIGGAEHAVLHLLYSRFWHKVLFDLERVSTPEPFKKLFNQGMITADAFVDERGAYVDIREVETRDGEAVHVPTGKTLQRFSGKMGKRYKNGLPPEEVGEEFGVDTFRLYEMYMGPLDAGAPWSMEGIRGMQRFLQRVWRNFVDQDRKAKRGGELAAELEKRLHKTIKKVAEDIEALRFNTAIAALIELNNELVQAEEHHDTLARTFFLLLAPLAPHIAEELWVLWGFGNGDISTQAWPAADTDLMLEETVTLPIQINGKVRGNIEVPVDMGEAELRSEVLGMENIRKYVSDPARVARFIVVPRRIVNIVVK